MSNLLFAQTVRVTTANRVKETIDVDGFLNEEAWEQAEIATDFIQNVPVFGVKPTQETEVRLLYNDDGLYIGATLYDQEPDKILKEFSQRDNIGNADWFGFVVDTYSDGLNGFGFIVTASGIQRDFKISAGFEDDSWDGIWVSKVRFDQTGWHVEMFIPYLSLRFPNVEEQNWKIQYGREIRRHREEVYWNPVDPEIDGFINQTGKLLGVKDIEAPVRLSFTPFVTGYTNFNYNSITKTTEVSPAYTAGMDLKYGINDAFTLDMTLIPDFGQVLSDQQVLNLSPFEVFFNENRQFFTEGIELFNKGNLFYTRRVGGRPYNYFKPYSETGLNEIVESNPEQTQLYNAVKVSGRAKSGTGLGFFNGITGEEFATIRNVVTGESRRLKTNSLTNYNVLVADQNLPNNSVVTLVNTNVYRQGEDEDANVTGLFFLAKDKSQKYGMEGKLVRSHISKSQGFDDGYSYSFNGGKIGGNWRSTLGFLVETDDYNINDVGFLQSANEKIFEGRVTYNDFKPKISKQQRWRVGITTSYARLYKPDKFTNLTISSDAFLLWKSRNAIGFNLNVEPIETYDYFEPRTFDFSRYLAYPRNGTFGGFISTDYRKTFAVDIRSSYRYFDQEGREITSLEVEPRVRVNDKFRIIFSTSFDILNNDIGFVSQALYPESIDGLSAGDIMMGRRDRQIVTNSINTRFIFTNNMFIEGRIRHYWDKVGYDGFFRLKEDGGLALLNFDGEDDGVAVYDRNVNFFNVDLNYTWRFAPGSDIIFNWKQSIFGEDRDLDNQYFANLGNLFSKSQENSISVKVIYFLDYNSLING